MSDHHTTRTVGALASPNTPSSRLPAILTRAVWALWIVALGVAGAFLLRGGPWTFGAVGVDGLTVAMWVTVPFISGIVHSYSRRYMAGEPAIDRFFERIFGFTVVVLVLVAADHLLLFLAAWLAMGLLMADLIGHVREWSQARSAARLARRSFVASTGLVGVAALALWWQTGAQTITGLGRTLVAAPGGSTMIAIAAVALLLAAMVQSALLPFHGWLLSSMTAPTPASALMHAGFVNAGGILLVRFAPVLEASWIVVAVVAVGAASALGGKLLKSVQTDVKGALGCSTVGQMGFMIMQAGFGFYAAAITHLILHGFYKAHHFLGSGSRVARESPGASSGTESTGIVGAAVAGASAIAGGVVFAVLTGKGMHMGGGLLLTLLVVLTVLRAAREIAAEATLPPGLRYGAVPLIAVPAIALYAVVYRSIERLLSGLAGVGQPVALTPLHGVIAIAFVLAYLVIETGAYRRSDRLYVALRNLGEPAVTTTSAPGEMTTTSPPKETTTTSPPGETTTRAQGGQP